ncbi:hypothetical protein MUGA111182_11515 [Mucilaginibacter galii]|uniref:Uncharacterized protein n=1 Tax=Mucilaginibacter galii TaxID=2005073 RepID=A0A917N2P4_9SPHI|nr:hypothetical protein [Mucilaginibacter galii]GGI52160.1 hypothetical protein GCM10011425_33720 [Mucilaginibacter galii]
MDVKYTFRDLVVYLLTGFAVTTVITFTFPSFFEEFLAFLHPNDIKNLNYLLHYIQGKDTITVLMSIPLFYLLGHLIQILDLIFTFYCARFFKKYNWLKLLYKFAGSTTVEYQRNKQGVSEPTFIVQEYTVRIKDKYTTVEYYYLLKELFNGLRTFMILFTFILLFMLCWGKVNFSLFFVNAIILILSWFKAYNSASNYVWIYR